MSIIPLIFAFIKRTFKSHPRKPAIKPYNNHFLYSSKSLLLRQCSALRVLSVILINSRCFEGAVFGIFR